MKVQWYGPKCRATIWKLLARNLTNAMDLLLVDLKLFIGIQGPPRSRPGEPPHIDSGDLIASYEVSLDTTEIAGRIGTDIPYAAFLELGTSEMQARPHLRKTALANATKIAQEMGRP